MMFGIIESCIDDFGRHPVQLFDQKFHDDPSQSLSWFGILLIFPDFHQTTEMG